jgi:hypothetical protein
MREIGKAYEDVVKALGRLTAAIDKKTAEIASMTVSDTPRAKAKSAGRAKAGRPCRGFRKAKGAGGEDSEPSARKGGLTDSVLKSLAADTPSKVAEIVERLPGHGYEVEDAAKTKLAVFQTLNRLLKSEKVIRAGKGEYQLAAAAEETAS